MAETKKKGLAFWQDSWDKNDIRFHKLEVNGMLQKHNSILNPDGKEKKFFVPLCGKTLDMKWLLDQGHTVVGLEGVKKGLEDFYTEHGLEWTEKDAPSMGPGCQLLENTDGKLKLYAGDIFCFNKSVEGQFDCIWDRGSLVALDREDVGRYIQLIKCLLKPGGKMLFECFEYEKSIFEGLSRPPPPHPMFKDEILSLFESDCTVEILDKSDRMLKEKKVDLIYYLIVKQ